MTYEMTIDDYLKLPFWEDRIVDEVIVVNEEDARQLFRKRSLEEKTPPAVGTNYVYKGPCKTEKSEYVFSIEKVNIIGSSL